MRAASISTPTFAPNLAGLGKVAWARGNTELAIERYSDVVARYPSAEFVVALADLYATSGRPGPAADQEAVVRAMHDLAAANGVNVDLELALFDADHGDPEASLRGRARRSGAGAGASTSPTRSPGPCTRTAGSRRPRATRTARSGSGRATRCSCSTPG